MVQDRAIVTTEDQYKVVYDQLIIAIFSDLERPLTQISRSCRYSTLNISTTVQDRHVYSEGWNSCAIYRMVPFSMSFYDT